MEVLQGQLKQTTKAMMEAARGTDRWRTGVSILLVTASLALSCVTCAQFHTIERVPSLRFGSHIDGVTLILSLAFLLGISGVWLAPKSKRWLAIVLFVISFLVGAFCPAMYPGR